MVVRGRLTPFRYSPVVVVHTGEAAITAPGRCEGGTCVGVGPGIAAVSGAVDFVGPVANAPSRVVHGGDVDVARDLVAGDLDVAEGGVGQLSLGPGDTVVSREADEDIKAASEVVPGDVHSAVKLRGCVIYVARLSVVRTAGVNASANRPGEAAVSGRPVAEALSAAARSDKNGMPCGVQAVVKDNRVAEVRSVATTEGAGREAREGRPAVRGV